MKTTFLFDFTIDKSTSTVFVIREFAAEHALVWNAFTVGVGNFYRNKTI